MKLVKLGHGPLSHLRTGRAGKPWPQLSRGSPLGLGSRWPRARRVGGLDETEDEAEKAESLSELALESAPLASHSTGELGLCASRRTYGRGRLLGRVRC